MIIPFEAVKYVFEYSSLSLPIRHIDEFASCSEEWRGKIFAMKRKNEWDERGDGVSSFETDVSSSSSVNPWTSRPYSSRYYEILKKREQLPVYEFKSALQKAVRDNQVVIVEGETGSG